MDIFPQLLKKYPFFHSEIAHILVGNTFHHTDRLIKSRILFVYDGNTAYIANQYKPQHVISLNLAIPRALPTIHNCAKVMYFIKNYNITKIFGVGTGAINDICKYTSYLSGIEYCFVPTALSMNGIVSSNVSLYREENKVKQSINAHAPNTIILDEDILMQAPKKFIGSAIMDSLAAYTACNDFIFASQLEHEKYPFEQRVFDVFDEDMSSLLDIIQNNVNLLYTDFPTIRKVFNTLYLSGCIMNYYGSSIAFSGGEHHIAHTLEHNFPTLSKKYLHGEIISAILPFYANLQTNFNGVEYIPKNIVKHNNRFNFKEIANTLEMPSRPEDIGISEDDFFNCVKEAKFAKERPTLLSVLF